MANLKNYKTYTISRNMQSPIMFWGLPLALSLAYLGAFVFFAILAMVLVSNETSIIITLVVCLGGASVCMGGIKLFYKKFGVDGFQKQQRDVSLPSAYVCDKSVNQILRERLKNKK